MKILIAATTLVLFSTACGSQPPAIDTNPPPLPPEPSDPQLAKIGAPLQLCADSVPINALAQWQKDRKDCFSINDEGNGKFFVFMLAGRGNLDWVRKVGIPTMERVYEAWNRSLKTEQLKASCACATHWPLNHWIRDGLFGYGYTCTVMSVSKGS